MPPTWDEDATKDGLRPSGTAYEPVHDLVRAGPSPLRALCYPLGFMVIEYTAGWLIRRTTGLCPWDYTGRCRWHRNGLMRWDYVVLWAFVGLGLEPAHDFLLRLTPCIGLAMRTS